LTDLAGTKPRPVTPEGTSSHATPDGKFFVRWSGDRAWLDPVAGGEPREVKGLLEGEAIAGWGPEERHVFAYRTSEIPAKVFRVDTATGSRELVREVAPSDSGGVFGLFLRMTPDGKACVYNVPQWLSQLHVIEGLR
jgi:hypothetical protein